MGGDESNNDVVPHEETPSPRVIVMTDDGQLIEAQYVRIGKMPESANERALAYLAGRLEEIVQKVADDAVDDDLKPRDRHRAADIALARSLPKPGVGEAHVVVNLGVSVIQKIEAGRHGAKTSETVEQDGSPSPPSP